MKRLAPSRMWGTALALIMSALLVGCGIDTLGSIIRKVQATNDSNRLRLLPSWPFGLRVEIGEASVAWDKIQRDLDKGLAKSGATTSTDASGVPVIEPPATSIPTINLGEKLRADSTTSSDIATVSFGIPITSKTIDPTVIRLAETPAGQSTFPFGPPIGNQTLSSAKAAADALNISNTVGLPQAANLDKVERKVQDIPDVQTMTLSSGSLTIPLSNETAGTLTVLLKLSDGANQVLSSPATITKVLAPRTSETIAIDLSGKIITAPLITEATTSGNIPAGTTLDKINPDTDKIQVGPTTIAMDATEATVHLPRKQGSNPNAAGYDANLKEINQTFNVSSRIPAESGVKKVTAVKVATGSITLDVTNGFGVDGDMTIRFFGINSPFNTLAGPIVRQGDGSLILQVNSNQQATATIDLAGADIRPDSNGNIQAVVSPVTLDTDSDRTHGNATLPAHNYSRITKNDKLFGTVVMSSLVFESVTGSFDRTQAITPSNVPLDLPPEFTETGIQPGRVNIGLIIKNQSAISGTLTPSVAALDANAQPIKKADGKPLTVQFEGASAVFPRIPFKGDFTGTTEFGATASTRIEINERNSNIVDVLQAGAKFVAFGGDTRVFGNDITLTRHDVLGGRVEIGIPLALIVAPFGVGTSKKPYDLPPSPLGIDASTAEQMDKYLKSASLDFRCENGWGLPLSLSILMSPGPDPYKAGAAVLTRVLSLGSGPVTLSSIELTEEDSKKLSKLTTLGVRISSAGTAGQVVQLHRSDALKIRIAARIKVQVSPELAGGVGK
jgi:hypothetical protein